MLNPYGPGGTDPTDFYHAQYMNGPQGAWQFGGQQNLDMQKYLGDLQSRTTLQAAQIPYTYKQGIYNSLMPYMQHLVAANGLGGGKHSQMGSGLIGPTHISQGGVFNPQQIQQQVNQSRSQTDQATQGQIQTQQNQLAGRGFGASSPLAALLQQNAQSQGNATNANNETNFRLGAAQANQQAIQGEQQGQGQINSAYNQSYVAQEQARYNALVGILGSFGNLM